MAAEKVFLGRDNTIDLILKADGVAVDLSSVTRMILTVGTKTIDSAVYATAIDWSPSPAVTGKIVLALGMLTSGAPPVYVLSAGTYTATLVVIDATNVDGIVWGDFRIQVE